MSLRAVGLAGCQAGLESLPLPEAMDWLVRLEAAGLDGLWVNEEHIAGRHRGRVCWPTMPFLSYVAAAVPRVRLGTAALLLPLHHPLRLAEEIAALCEFAPGRVCIGIAPSRPGAYADAFGLDGVDHRAEFSSVHTALRTLLAGDTVDRLEGHHRGRAISALVVPTHGPRFYRAAYSVESLRAAAGEQMPLIQHYIQSPDAVLAGRDVYRAAAGEKADSLLAGSPVHRFVVLDENDRDAEQATLQLAEQLTARLRGFGIARNPGVTTPAELEPHRFAQHTAIAGSPATVLSRLRDLAVQTGTETININLGWMGVADPERVRRSAALLLDRILPVL